MKKTHSKFSMYKFLASSEEEILASINTFKKNNGHYPSYKELNDCDYTPTARTIIRRFGSLKQFREKFSLGESDLRTGNVAQSRREETMKKRIEILKYVSTIKDIVFDANHIDFDFSLKGKRYKISINPILPKNFPKDIIIIKSINDLKKNISA